MQPVSKTKRKYWLMKSEPDVYSIDDLEREGVGEWGDIRNYQVRNMLRDVIQSGDLALFYHSNSKEIGCVGVMEVVGEAYPDPSQFDTRSPYFDSRSKKENPRWLSVQVQFVEKFMRIITLAEIKHNLRLSKMAVAQKGSRLSVTPVLADDFTYLLALAKKPRETYI